MNFQNWNWSETNFQNRIIISGNREIKFNVKRYSNRKKCNFGYYNPLSISGSSIGFINKLKHGF